MRRVVDSIQVSGSFLRAMLFLVLLSLDWSGLAQAQRVHEGYLMYGKESGRQRLYYYKIIEDSTVFVRAGADEGGPALTLPALVIRSLASDLESLSEADSLQKQTFVVGIEGNRLNLILAQRIDLLIYAFVLLAVAWVVFIFVFRSRLRKHKKRQDTLVESRRGLVEDREAERRRLAQELHDGPVQDLHAIRMMITMQAENENSVVTRIEGDLLRVIRELRAISEDLRPPALVPFGLGAALHALIERFEQRYPEIHVHADIAKDEQRLPERIRLALFRICQEALNNTVHHASATAVSVRFEIRGERVLLEVQDNGVGFVVPSDWVHFVQQGHYGLLGMAERAESIDAAFEVISAPNEGTRVRVEVSVAPDPSTGRTERVDEGAVPA